MTVNLHLSKEDFNRHIRILNNRIDLLTKHVADQKQEIKDLKFKLKSEKEDNRIKRRLRDLKDEKLNEYREIRNKI